MATSSPATPPAPERNVWHRHWIVLIRATAAPVAGLLSLVGVWLFGGGPTGFPAQVILVVGSLVLIFQGVQAMSGVPKEVAETPLSQRQRVLQRVNLPMRFIMAAVAFTLAGAALTLVPLAMIAPATFAPYLKRLYILWGVAVVVWLAINTVDWRNDVYILTSDRIIDQVRFPILYDQRTVARLDQVQNVRYQQGVLGRFLNFGDVTVETAGRGQAVVFLEVPKPAEIQSIIFRRIDQLNERLAMREAERQREQLAVWFTAYHDLATRIEVLAMPETVPAEHPARPEWRINLPPGVRYETWVTHDTESHARDNLYRTEMDPHPGEGRRRFREIIPTPQSGYLYLKIWLRVLAAQGAEQQGEEFATREFAIRVV